VATAPNTDFQRSSPFTLEAPALRLAELVRLQKSAQRITSTLNLDEIIDRVVAYCGRKKNLVGVSSREAASSIV